MFTLCEDIKLNKNLILKIDSLPPLPQTAISINDFRNKEDKNPNELIAIVEKDPLIVSTLLKVSNSAMFGFKKRIESAKMAVSLLGVNFTISLTLGGAIKNCIETSLAPYGVETNSFLENAALTSSFAARWASKVDSSLQNRVILPSFLFKTGKFVIAMSLCDEGKEDDFKKEILTAQDTRSVEIKYVGSPTHMVTAAIFKHWHLDESLISDLEDIEQLFEQNNSNLKIPKMLYIIDILCNISRPFHPEQIEYALEYAKKFDFDTQVLMQVINSFTE